MKTKSVVLKEFRQLLELKYTGTTPSNYTYHVSLFLDFVDVAPLRVTNEDILNYNLSIKDKSFSFRNVAINAIKAYFKLYLRKKIKNFSVIRPKKQKRAPRQIPHDFLMQKINSTKNTKAKAILSLGYGCGLRSNEVLNLKITDIDIEQECLLINGKGNRQRVGPIPEAIGKLLIAYVDEYNPKEYLFNGQFSIQYSASSILKLVKQNIGNYKFHDLRHSYAMYVYQNTNDIKAVKELLGHQHLKTTEIYVDATLNQLQLTITPFSNKIYHY